MSIAKNERGNVYSHGLGIGLSIAALVLLLLFDSGKSVFSTFGILVYAISLLFLYTASTLYHAVNHEERKHFFRKIDHIGIYLLIAGTYTPVSLISLVEHGGWLLFWIVWSIAVFGTILKIFFTGKYERLSLLLYLIMGWLIVFDIRDVMEIQSTLGLFLLGMGGFFYTVGTFFYVKEKIPYNHLIWHCFVLAGSISHFCFIFFDVI
ncbi:MAG TPA: hemolysin III family protein [Flavobacteriaceae bacterium]|nr:hemolysin III family protein [Flavobacteriaceae bacterium]MCB9213243.1 hemolysin III family protein [Alteromonas sp.]HPF10086.1 hemolysin III family protein [Flavobacteriaceae bacterium]HQU22625.1 hemolysin III family protein [Flavobacteriaceae bacterium]HQU66400.1 hemolysin III family protein [Flavobacteriaceae bacterium]